MTECHLKFHIQTFKTNTYSLCPVDSRIIRSSYNPPTNILKICLTLLLERGGYGCGLGTENGLANVAMEKRMGTTCIYSHHRMQVKAVACAGCNLPLPTLIELYVLRCLIELERVVYMEIKQVTDTYENKI